MPNGFDRSPEALDALRSAFESIAPAIHTFVDRHHLGIEYYYHGFPSWEIRFLRRIGGVGQIEISWDEEETKGIFRVFADWWVDDYDSETRFSVDRKIGEHRMGQDPDHLMTLLEEALNQVDSWKPDDLREVESGSSWWKEVWKTAKEYYKAQADNLFDIWSLHYGKKSIR